MGKYLTMGMYMFIDNASSYYFDPNLPDMTEAYGIQPQGPPCSIVSCPAH